MRRPNITFLTLKEKCASLDYLKVSRHEADHIEPNMKKIRTLVQKLKVDGLKIRLVEHDSILRYSFVMGDDGIWVKFYKNATGKSDVPAIKVSKGTILFDFFAKDVDDLINSTPRNLP